MNDMPRSAPFASCQAGDPVPGRTTRPEPVPPQHNARVLTGGGPTAHLILDGQVYTLRITRAGKLILTK